MDYFKKEKDFISHQVVYESIEDAIEHLGLSKSVRWVVLNGELYRHNKKTNSPEFVVSNGSPVQIKLPI